MSQLPPTHQIMDRYRCYTPATRDNNSSQHEVGTLFFLCNSSLCGPLNCLESPGLRRQPTGLMLQDTHGQSCIVPVFMHGPVTCDLCYQCSTSCICSLTAAGDESPLLPGLIPKPAQSSKAVSQPSFCGKFLSSSALASFYSFLPLALLLFCHILLLFLCCFALFSCSCIE